MRETKYNKKLNVRRKFSSSTKHRSWHSAKDEENSPQRQTHISYLSAEARLMRECGRKAMVRRLLSTRRRIQNNRREWNFDTRVGGGETTLNDRTWRWWKKKKWIEKSPSFSSFYLITYNFIRNNEIRAREGAQKREMEVATKVLLRHHRDLWQVCDIFFPELSFAVVFFIVTRMNCRLVF